MQFCPPSYTLGLGQITQSFQFSNVWGACVYVCMTERIYIKYAQWLFLGTRHMDDSYFSFHFSMYLYWNILNIEILIDWNTYICVCITFIIRKIMKLILKLEREIHTSRHKKHKVIQSHVFVFITTFSLCREPCEGVHQLTVNLIWNLDKKFWSSIEL